MNWKCLLQSLKKLKGLFCISVLQYKILEAEHARDLTIIVDFIKRPRSVQMLTLIKQNLKKHTRNLFEKHKLTFQSMLFKKKNIWSRFGTYSIELTGLTCVLSLFDCLEFRVTFRQCKSELKSVQTFMYILLSSIFFTLYYY